MPSSPFLHPLRHPGTIVGREHEVDDVLRVLSRRTKNNPVLVGDAGVGKTAIVEVLAGMIAANHPRLPDALRGARLLSLDVGALLAGTAYRGEFEKRLQGVLDLVSTNRSIVLFIDEIHTLMGAGRVEGSVVDAANLFKAHLARGHLRCIGATTISEYQQHIERDAAFERRFQKVFVREPSEESTVQILRALRPGLEAHHGVRVTDAALRAAVQLTTRYVPARHLPDKAIDALDDACADVRIALQRHQQLSNALRERWFEGEMRRRAGTAAAAAAAAAVAVGGARRGGEGNEEEEKGGKEGSGLSDELERIRAQIEELERKGLTDRANEVRRMVADVKLQARLALRANDPGLAWDLVFAVLPEMRRRLEFQQDEMRAAAAPQAPDAPPPPPPLQPPSSSQPGPEPLVPEQVGLRLAKRNDQNDKAEGSSREQQVVGEEDEKDEEEFGGHVSARSVRNVVSRWTSIPISRVHYDEQERSSLLGLGDRLATQVLGQRGACDAVANAVVRSRAGLSDPTRPTACFLFAGPSGVGKTELCRALAAELFLDEACLVKLDMAEFAQSHALSRLLGAPPGYPDHWKGGELTGRVRERPHSVVVLERVDKAHPSVLSALQQVVCEGTLTDSQGRACDFRNCVVIMTTNAPLDALALAAGDDDAAAAARPAEGTARNLPTELLAHVDVVGFVGLDAGSMHAVCARAVKGLAERALANGGLTLAVADDVVAHLAARCRSVRQGARLASRLVEQLLADPLAAIVLRGEAKRGDTVRAGLHDGKVTVRVQQKKGGDRVN